jgi:polyphosphate kinase
VQSYLAISKAAHTLVEKQYQIFNNELMPTLAEQGVRLVSHGERTPEQKRWVAKYFESDVRPLLVPVALDPSHPFPQVANKSLNFIVALGGNDAFGRSNNIAIVRVPRALPRLIKLPKTLSGKQQLFVSLSSVIRSHLASLFTGREVLSFSQFRVTRHSDLAVDEEDVKNLRTALRKGLVQRNFGDAVRLEVSNNCDEKLAKLLLQQFDLPKQSLYRVHGPVNLARLMQLADLAEGANLKFKPFEPRISQQLVPGQSYFGQLKQQDVLIHQPYESFESVIDFLREAVHDPDVVSIQQTIYRTGSDPRMLKLLQEAVRRGKEVMAVVELKARFDEEANINWAEDLESVGAQVVYGIVGLKTHAKMLLVMRREVGRA